MGNDRDFVLGAQGKGVPRSNLPPGPATGENSRDAEVEPRSTVREKWSGSTAWAMTS